MYNIIPQGTFVGQAIYFLAGKWLLKTYWVSAALGGSYSFTTLPTYTLP